MSDTDATTTQSRPGGSSSHIRTAGGGRASAWIVHALTASGAVCGVLALSDTAAGRYRRALGWMALAVAVDSIDGSLARWLAVRRRLPQIDGELLDNVVDYLNYVVVPAWFMLQARLLPSGWATIAVAAICWVSALRFAHAEAKTPDQFFTGFPSYWNVLAFYLLLIRPDPRLALGIVAFLCVMVFAPVQFVYPSRTPAHRGLTLTLTIGWCLCALILLARYPEPHPALLYGSLLYPVYYTAVSLKLTRERRSRRGSGPAGG